MSTVVDDETRFNELRVHFGSEDDADQLTINGYALLPDEDVKDLILRVKNFRVKDELLQIRARVKQAQLQQAQQSAQEPEAISRRSKWKVNTSPHVVLGDDQDGPHSSAIIIGRRTVLACAHSLGLLIDESKRNTKTKTHYKYLENYWVQPSFTRNIEGEFTDDNRVPIKLFKFHVRNDWALFERVDGQLFDESDVATIDTSPLTDPGTLLGFEKTAVLHCPVSLKSSIIKAGEFSVGCQIAFGHLQSQSTHHVKYEVRDLCRGSSGGGVYVDYSTSVLGMHIEAINEADYDVEDIKNITDSKKRVNSEDEPYSHIETSNPPAPKKKKSDSETIASIAAGNNGLGSEIIICKFSRLMHYIAELETNEK